MKHLYQQLRLFIAEKLLGWSASIAPKDTDDGLNIKLYILQYFSGGFKDGTVFTLPIPSPTQDQFYSIINANCGNCIHKKQGPYACYCSHPDQINEHLKGYVYWGRK